MMSRLLALVLACSHLPGQTEAKPGPGPSAQPPGLDATPQPLCGAPVPGGLLTTPERTGWQRTSTSNEVRDFLARLLNTHPKAFDLATIGRTLQGRAIQVASIRRGDRTAPRLRALIIANIHGGEVEGKEAIQVLLREIALGQHGGILASCDLWLMPIFNVDGNDEIDPGNRASQNGPPAVGKRANSQGFDLNRDFVKLESPEARALLGLLREVDPHLFMDLHTTNGSAHGYHLTYSPSLATNLDPDLDALLHDRFIPAVRAAILKHHGFRIFDYGNFNRTRRDPPSSWTTYDHKPRLVFNYVGLRNRLSLLSEAYSYLPFRKRALVTRAFVLESLHQLIERRGEILRLCAQADQRTVAGDARFGYDSALRAAVRGEVLVGRLDQQPAGDHRNQRYIATEEYKAVEMDIRVRFAARKSLAYPIAWAVVDPSEAVRRTLLIHGLRVQRLTEPVEVTAQSYQITSMRRPRLVYQGHRLVTLRGALVEGSHRLPAGTLIVSARQPLARIAAQLLEAESEDSLASWEFYGTQLMTEDDPARKGLGYPVLRVTRHPTWREAPIALNSDDLRVTGPYRPAPKELPAEHIAVKMICAKVGRRESRGAYERQPEWRDREVVWSIGARRLSDASALGVEVKALLANRSLPCVLTPGALITNDELVQTAELLTKAGALVVYLERQPE